jgi:hypothetical protein
MDERGYEGDLQLDLLATQRGRGGQCGDQVETLRKLSDRFNQSGALQRPLSGFAPKVRGLFDQPGFGAVARQNLRLVLSDVSEAAFIARLPKGSETVFYLSIRDIFGIDWPGCRIFVAEHLRLVTPIHSAPFADEEV